MKNKIIELSERINNFGQIKDLSLAQLQELNKLMDRLSQLLEIKNDKT